MRKVHRLGSAGVSGKFCHPIASKVALADTEPQDTLLGGQLRAARRALHGRGDVQQLQVLVGAIKN
jgi:hypothetical protein